jgi:hypothetical protein
VAGLAVEDSFAVAEGSWVAAGDSQAAEMDNSAAAASTQACWPAGSCGSEA